MVMDQLQDRNRAKKFMLIIIIWLCKLLKKQKKTVDVMPVMMMEYLS